MNTPEGWATASLLYKLLRKPPRRHSHQELVLQLYVLKREYNESEATKILVLSSMREEYRQAVTEAWSEHVQARFPWIIYAQKQTAEDIKKTLDEEVAQGVTVSPHLPPEKKPETLLFKKNERHQRRTPLPAVPQPLGRFQKRRTR